MHRIGSIREPPEISHSFGRLRRLRDSFDQLRNGRPRRAADERTALDILGELGVTAVPLLGRVLRDGDDGRASWAYFLLGRLGGSRVVELARALVADDAIPDGRKALGLALLSDLGADLPERVTLADPAALREASVRELLDSLREPADVAH